MNAVTAFLSKYEQLMRELCDMSQAVVTEKPVSVHVADDPVVTQLAHELDEDWKALSDMDRLITVNLAVSIVMNRAPPGFLGQHLVAQHLVGGGTVQ